MSDKPKRKPKGKPKKILWCPQHRAISPIGAEDRAAEIRYYDPNDPPPGAPGGPVED